MEALQHKVPCVVQKGVVLNLHTVKSQLGPKARAFKTLCFANVKFSCL